MMSELASDYLWARTSVVLTLAMIATIGFGLTIPPLAGALAVTTGFLILTQLHCKV
jgi:hypothetical protein